MLQTLYHLHEFLWDSVQALYNPVLPDVGRCQRGSLWWSQGNVVVLNALQRAHIVPAWSGPWQSSWGAALPVSSSSAGSLMSSLPAEKMELLLHAEGKTMTLLISICGSHLPYGPWFLISISVSYPRLFKEREVQSTPGELCCQHTQTLVPSLWPCKPSVPFSAVK